MAAYRVHEKADKFNDQVDVNWEDFVKAVLGEEISGQEDVKLKEMMDYYTNVVTKSKLSIQVDYSKKNVRTGDPSVFITGADNL